MAVMQRTRGQELETTSDESDSVANDSTNFGIHQWSTRGMADIFSDEQSDDDTEKHKASLIEKQSLISAYYVDITKHCRELLGADLPKNGKKALQKFLTEYLVEMDVIKLREFVRMINFDVSNLLEDKQLLRETLKELADNAKERQTSSSHVRKMLRKIANELSSVESTLRKRLQLQEKCEDADGKEKKISTEWKRRIRQVSCVIGLIILAAVIGTGIGAGIGAAGAAIVASGGMASIPIGAGIGAGAGVLAGVLCGVSGSACYCVLSKKDLKQTVDELKTLIGKLQKVQEQLTEIEGEWIRIVTLVEDIKNKAKGIKQKSHPTIVKRKLELLQGIVLSNLKEKVSLMAEAQKNINPKETRVTRLKVPVQESISNQVLTYNRQTEEVTVSRPTSTSSQSSIA